MELMIGGVTFALALLCAATMGLAIQRGTTCTVVALDELLRTRRPTRLLAIVEASVWVGGGLLLAHAFAQLHETPADYAVTRWTLLGAALLGIGAVVNRGCIFGTVARFGSGEWAYAATPVGFFVGSMSVQTVFAPPAPQVVPAGSPVLDAPAWVAWLFVGFALFRLARLFTQRGTSKAQWWSPHAATTVIGITFVGMFLLAGAWAYTDVLVDVVRGMAHSVAARALLALALLLGAIAGGIIDRPLRGVPVTAVAVARCFMGGVLMGWGGLLVPGGNDGLILLGMPLLWPYAWAAFAVMCVVITLSLMLAQRLSVRRRSAATPT